MEQNGLGLWRNPIQYVSSIIYGRNDYQPKVRDLLQQYGDSRIIAMEVRRTPLSRVLMSALNVASFGKLQQNNPYDTLFHLSLVVKLDTGDTLLIEKNEVINMSLNPIVVTNTESKEVPLLGFLTVNDLLKNTRERMGQQYFIYSARNQNCQDFIANILIANGLDTPELLDFIKQDSIKIFGDMVRFRKVANTITDIAGRINVITQGHGEGLELITGRSISHHNGLANIELEKLLQHVPNFSGVYMKDKLPSKLKNGHWYIINLENSYDGNGTHWTCFKVGGKTPTDHQGNSIEYYDAFGFPPPIELMNRAKGSIKWSNKQIQNVKSTACGWYCVGRISSPLSYQKFIDCFSTNTVMNDVILKRMLIQNGILDH